MEHQIHINAIKTAYAQLQGENRLPQETLFSKQPSELIEIIQKNLVWLASFTVKNRIWFVHKLVVDACEMTPEDADSVFEYMLKTLEGGK